MIVQLNRDADWATIDHEMCRVTKFTPLVSVENGKAVGRAGIMPYAFVSLDCPKLRPDTTGAITHKMDFLHLWEAFKVRGVADDEEVLISYIKSKLSRFNKIFGSMMPGLAVMVCQRGAYDLLNGDHLHPEWSGDARLRALRPLQQWIPSVLNR